MTTTQTITVLNRNPATINHARPGGRPASPPAESYRDSHRRIPALLDFAASLNVDVIVTYANPMVLAAKHAASRIPIIFAAAADPLGTGLVTSLARPGGNVTGLSIQHTDLASKRLELLRETVPGLRRLAIMANVGNPASVLDMSEVQAAARVLSLEVARRKRMRGQDRMPLRHRRQQRAARHR
jgi:putative tryptophan/tyrosine transport system substrate-binding protein